MGGGNVTMGHDDTTPSVAETLNVNSISVEDSYDGPRINDNKICEQFVVDLLERFKEQKKLHKKYAFEQHRWLTIVAAAMLDEGKNWGIIIAVRKMMMEAPSLIDIDIPETARLTVCGDVHGQFYDFLHIFNINGLPSSTNMYLFNGDFVDRGSFSLEVVVTLFAYKWLYPTSLFLARGNHETDNMNKVYGFEGEVKHKYSETMFKFMIYGETHIGEPILTLILVVHGGLFSKDDVTLDDIRNIDRIKLKQPGTEGLMCELLWSDPQPEPGRGPSKRGVGTQFGPDVTERFLEKNGLGEVFRVCVTGFRQFRLASVVANATENGYVIEHNGKCVTVFSAPNYWQCCVVGTGGGDGAMPCFIINLVPAHGDEINNSDTVGNKGALINISPDLKLEYKTFEAVWVWQYAGFVRAAWMWEDIWGRVMVEKNQVVRWMVRSME
ncbi:Metallo-dependent phosphatase-like protein, partial [Jimgerdemannia flammicorona]